MIEPRTQQHNSYKILLIGDSCIDEYRYGTVERISPEAPVPVVKISHTETKPGMVANVNENLRALGCCVDTHFGTPSHKSRVVDQRTRQQLIRIDHDTASTAFEPSTLGNIDHYDAVVISDYDKGFVSYDTIEQLRKQYSGPMFLDTKKTDIAAFYGVYVKINQLEYERRVSINDSLIVTLGSQGAMYKTGRDPKHETYYPAQQVEVADVTGAGDTFLAALTVEYLRTKDIGQAIEFAIRAATVTVQHWGCYAPSWEELCV